MLYNSLVFLGTNAYLVLLLERFIIQATNFDRINRFYSNYTRSLCITVFRARN